MTNKNLLSVLAITLVSLAACKSDFPAGSYGGGGRMDSSGPESSLATQDGRTSGPETFPTDRNPSGQESSAPTDVADDGALRAVSERRRRARSIDGRAST